MKTKINREIVVASIVLSNIIRYFLFDLWLEFSPSTSTSRHNWWMFEFADTNACVLWNSSQWSGECCSLDPPQTIKLTRPYPRKDWWVANRWNCCNIVDWPFQKPINCTDHTPTKIGRLEKLQSTMTLRYLTLFDFSTIWVDPTEKMLYQTITTQNHHRFICFGCHSECLKCPWNVALFVRLTQLILVDLSRSCVLLWTPSIRSGETSSCPMRQRRS